MDIGLPYPLWSFPLVDLRSTGVHCFNGESSRLIHKKPYRNATLFVPLHAHPRPEFRHAVVAAEDTRFYQHHGVSIGARSRTRGRRSDDRRVPALPPLAQAACENLFFGTGPFIPS